MNYITILFIFCISFCIGEVWYPFPSIQNGQNLFGLGTVGETVNSLYSNDSKDIFIGGAFNSIGIFFFLFLRNNLKI
jgi:hypothetical protein